MNETHTINETKIIIAEIGISINTGFIKPSNKEISKKEIRNLLGIFI